MGYRNSLPVMVASQRVHRSFHGRWLEWALCLSLFAGALSMRVASLNYNVQADELAWVWRSIFFRAALLAGDWRNTIYVGHPGVTTMLLGALAVQLRVCLAPATAQPLLEWLGRLAWLDPDNVQAFVRLRYFFPLSRLLVAVISSVGVVGIYGAGKRVLGRGAAWLSAALLAFDPFIAGLGGLMHVDSLLTMFTTLSLLALLAALGGGRFYLWMALSGAATGYAVLTKTSALLLGPACALLLLLGWWWTRRQRTVGQTIVAGLIWLASFAAVMATWPALWDDPLRVWGLATGMAGMLKEPVQHTGPGYYYGLVVALRTTPLTLVGAGAALAFVWIDRRRPEAIWSRRVTLVMLGWALVFLGVITAWGAKYDRYAAPALAALVLLSGIGCYRLATALWSRWTLPARLPKESLLLGVIAAQLGAALPCYPHLVSYADPLLGGGEALTRYGLTHVSNPALGMAAAYLGRLSNAELTQVATTSPTAFAPLFRGQTLLLSDETLSVADWAVLPGQGETDCPKLGSKWRLERAFAASGQGLTLVCASPYAQLLLDDLTRRTQPGDLVIVDADTALARAWTGQVPLFVVHDLGALETLAGRLADALQGVQRVWYVSYPAVSPVTRTWMKHLLGIDAPASPGQDLTGAGIQVYSLTAWPDMHGMSRPALGRYEDKLTLLDAAFSPNPASYPAFRAVLRWQAASRYDYHLKLALRDNAGHVRVMLKEQLLSSNVFASSMWEAGQTYESVTRVSLPPGLPPGEYSLEASVMDSVTGAHLGVWQADAFKGTTCSLGTIRISSYPGVILSDWLEMLRGFRIQAGTLNLVGISTWPDGGRAGDSLTFGVYWRAREPSSQAYRVRWRLVDQAGQIVTETVVPLSTYPTAQWIKSELIDAWYDVALDPLLPAGEYSLQLNVLKADGQAVWEQDTVLGNWLIEQPARSFAAPMSLPYPLRAQLGQELALLGYDLDRTELAPGDRLQVTLYWQVVARPGRNYMGFIHLLDADGAIVAQADRLMLEDGQPSSGWAVGQVIVEHCQVHIPAGAPAGLHIGLGVYDAESGGRLALSLPDGSRLPDDRLFLDTDLVVNQGE
ncbi:MAG: glycosyltransferase family 39 protein [Thermoflexales bacterium]|nr:glycosyltransferase family 39 protein [Thermoflexales bacterium]